MNSCRVCELFFELLQNKGYVQTCQLNMYKKTKLDNLINSWVSLYKRMKTIQSLLLIMIFFKESFTQSDTSFFAMFLDINIQLINDQSIGKCIILSYCNNKNVTLPAKGLTNPTLSSIWKFTKLFFCLDVAQGHMKGAPNETWTHSCRFASQAC